MYKVKFNNLCILPRQSLLPTSSTACLNAGDLRANSFFSLNSTPWDFLGGPVVKNLPCNAGDAGSTPGRGTKIPHAVEQLSPDAVTPEPEHHN